jgi:hypothetical protein
LSAGGLFTGAVKTDGTLWMWGQNNYGKIGVNSAAADFKSPVQVGALTDWAKVSCGSTHVLATTA